MEKDIVLKDIPEDEVKKVVADFESEDFVVTMARQGDGRWAVRASAKAPLTDAAGG